MNFRVDFGEKIQPGTFCYTICIYDNQGNISAPQQVCVTVKAFGGVSALVGNWSFLKAEQDSIIIFPNEKTCQTRKIECKGEIYDLLNCSFIPEKFELKINADGTYSYVEKYIEKEYTLEFMGSDCVKNTETFDHEFDIYEQTGKWAYDVDSQELVLIEYSSRELDTMEEELHSHTHEGGRLGIPNNRTIISGSSLTITIEDEALEGRKLFFSK